MKKTILIFAALILFLFVLCGCGDGEEAIAVSISFSQENCEIYENSVVFPEVVMHFSDGSAAISNPDNFWYIPKNAQTNALLPYVYVLEGIIYINKDEAPTAFSARIEVVYKDNTDIKAEIPVEKIQTDLHSISLKSENKKSVCQIGKSLQLIAELTPEGGFELRPQGTSFTDIQFSVSWDSAAYPGRCASITAHGGLLTVHSAAKVGMVLEVWVTVTAQDNIVKSASMQITVERAVY